MQWEACLAATTPVRAGVSEGSGKKCVRCEGVTVHSNAAAWMIASELSSWMIAHWLSSKKDRIKIFLMHKDYNNSLLISIF